MEGRDTRDFLVWHPFVINEGLEIYFETIVG